MEDDIPLGFYKEITTIKGVNARVWGNQVIEAKNAEGVWRIVNTKTAPGLATAILRCLIAAWDDVPTIKGTK